MTQLTNSFEGGTNGSTVTTGNSGGSSGSVFDATNIGTTGAVAFDNTQVAHGSLSAKFSIGASAGAAVLEWTTSMGSQTTIWFRMYCYFTANPSATLRIFRTQTSGASLCSAIAISTAGKILGLNGAGTIILTSTNSIPLNQWFRIEGFVTHSATAGQIEFKLFNSMDSSSATETQTSGTTVNTTGAAALYLYGSSGLTNVGPYWMDDIGLSNVAYIGPAIPQIAISDSGTASETENVAAAFSYSESGSGSEVVHVGDAIPITDSGTGSESVSILVSEAKNVADSGTGSESIGITSPVSKSVSDAGTASESLLAGLAAAFLGTPYVIGHVASSSNSNVAVIPVTEATSEGDAIIVGASVNSVTETVVSCQDSQGNEYNLVNTQNGVKYDGAMFLATTGPGGLGPTKPLSTSDIITLTNSLTNTNVKNAGAIGCSGVLQANTVDPSGTASGASSTGSTTPEAISGGLLQANELAVAWEDNGHTAGNVTWGTGWIPAITGIVSGADHISSMAYQVLASNGAATAIGSIPSAPWAMMLVTLLAAELAVSPFDSGTATEALSINSAVELTDSGSLTTTRFTSGALIDFGTCSDNLAITAASITVTDTGAGSENETVSPSEPYLRFGQSYTTGGASSGISVPIPAGLQVGDNIAIWCVVEGTSVATWTPPDVTWTVEAPQQVSGTNTVSVQLLHKVATLSDFLLAGSGFWNITMSTTLPWSCGLCVANGAAVGSPYDGVPLTSGVNETSPDTNVNSPALSLTSTDDLLIWMGATRSLSAGAAPQSISVPAGYTQAGSQANSSDGTNTNVGVIVAAKVGNSSGSVGSVAGSVPVTAFNSGLLLAFQPVPNSSPALSESGAGSDSLDVQVLQGQVTDSGVGTELTINPTIQSIAGAPTQDGFTVVSKVPGGTSLRMFVSDSPTMVPIVATISAQIPDSFSYVRHQVTGLESGTRYYYQLADTPLGSIEQATGPIGTCKTLFEAGLDKPASFRVALVSCITQAAADGAAMIDWTNWQADLGIFTGDFDYSGTTSTNLATQIGIYETQINTSVGLMRLIHDAWGYYCRSDHEAGPDNGDSDNTYTATNISAALEIFPWGTLGDQTNNPPRGLYQSWVVGRVRFIMIDIRNLDRSPGANTDNSSKTMLGAQQLAWFENELIQPEPLKVIISDVQWAGNATPFLLTNGPDKWWSYSTERSAILSYIAANTKKVKNLMLWHGDAHLLGTITPAGNASWGGFPVYCAAPMHNVGGGLDTGSFSQFYNNSDGNCRFYGRITITDDGSTISVNFVGWDAENQVARITQTDVFFAPLLLDSGVCTESFAVVKVGGAGETLAVVDDIAYAERGTGIDVLAITIRQLGTADNGVGIDTLVHTLNIPLIDSGSGSDGWITGTAKFLSDVGFG